jgi:hypothetical protein
VQGRTFKALIMFLLWCVLWFIWLGWIMHIIAPIDAALWKRRT